ncbi:outer membrane protein [Sphingomonas sp.]|jgi:outer membrane immunogenic protein|uniref:outer membrane protein n=1 Tax=Sphingomonas sp. TaxID=28214 RepID=UPI002ED78F8A
MRILLLSAVSLIATTAPAFAQDEAFSGVYVGGTFGYSAQNNDVGETIQFDRDLNGSFGDTVVTSAAGAPNAFSPGFCNGRGRTNSVAGGCENDRDNAEYSARVGFDIQDSNVAVGLVGEVGRSRIRDSVSAFSTTPATYTMTRKIDYNASLRVRSGYVAGNNTLFYVTGGVAYAKVDHSFRTTNVTNTFTGRGKDDVWGWAVGGGVEHKLGGGLSMGLEYLYTRYDDDDYRVRVGAGTALPNNPFLLAGAGGTDFRRSASQFDFHGIRTTLSFGF